MVWHVKYRYQAVDHIERYPTPERAIEEACRLIDQGREVRGIGTGPLSDSIRRDQIDLIYGIWVRAKYPYHGYELEDTRRCASR